MNAKEKMLAGLPFDTHDADLGREREKATRLLQKLNTITLFDGAYREILRELPVSYTHLDVYKRQVHSSGHPSYRTRIAANGSYRWTNLPDKGSPQCPSP